MIRIAQRPYLFVDDTLVDHHDGTSLVLHSPERKGIALATDAPWEGPESAYFTVVDNVDANGVDDGDRAADERYLLYYRGQAAWGPDYKDATCVAQSADGISWKRRLTWSHEFGGSFANNIVWSTGDQISQNMAPFADTNPDAAPDARYKAVGGIPEGGGLFALASSDGFDWRIVGDGPVMVGPELDSLNTAFWDSEKGCYALYYRKWRKTSTASGGDPDCDRSVRSISRALSDDFETWYDHQPLDFGDTPLEDFYTSAMRPYERDPGLYLGFPKRLMPFRTRHPEHDDVGVSDAVLLASRDGVSFPRHFMEGFVRPGLDRRNWTDRSIMFAPGMIRTSPTEYSLYWSEHYGHHDNYLMRGTIRVDGFASLRAGCPGGKAESVPVMLDGDSLVLNMSTSAAGTITVGILDEQKTPVPGFATDDCDELFGDDIEREVTWNGSPDISRISGQTVRLEISLEDADLFSVSAK
jgi:hypothetical protein